MPWRGGGPWIEKPGLPAGLGNSKIIPVFQRGPPSIFLMVLLSLLSAPLGSRAQQRAQTDLVEVSDHLFPEEIAQELSGSSSGWLPYYVELKGLGERAVRVELTGTVQKYENGKWTDRFVTRQSIEVAPGAPTRTWLHLHFDGGGNDDFRVRGTVLAGGRQSLALPDKDLSFGVDSNVFPMFVTGEHTMASRSPWGSSNLPTQIGEISPRGIVRVPEKALPDQVIGFSTIRLLVLRNPDLTVMEPAQMNAIRLWVFLGGWVILVPSPRGELFRSALLGNLLPGAKIGELQTVAGHVPRTLWAGGRQARRVEIGAVDPGEGSSYTIIDPVRIEGDREILSSELEEAGTSSGAGASPPANAVRLFYEVGYGAGRVGVMTFDDMSFGEPSLTFRRVLWRQILEGGRQSASAVLHWDRRRSGDQLARAVGAGLTREIGVWFIVFLVVGYLLVIGPGLYFLLKRWKRLPAIVWVEPLVVLVYIGIIALTAYVTKGVLTRVRTLTVFEHVAGAPFAVKRSYLGLFSSGETVYRISAPGSSLILPVESGDRVVRISNSPPGPELQDWQIAQWGIGTFTAWGLQEVAPDFGLEIELNPREAGWIEEAREVTIRNNTDLDVSRGFLISSAGKIYNAGSISPGQEVVIQGPLQPAEILEKSEKAEAATGNPFPRDDLLRNVVNILRSRGAPFSRLRYIGILQREEDDFEVNHASSLDHRVDLIVEYSVSNVRGE